MNLRPRRIPVTWTLMAVVLVANLATGAALRPSDAALRRAFALGADRLLRGHDAFTLVTGVLLADGPAELILVLLAILLVVGTAERRIGHGRTALAYATTAIGGGLLGVGAQAAGLLTRGVWSTPPANTLVFHPFTPVFGVALTASAFAGPLWRRRIRVLGFALLIVVLLYSGQAGDVYRLAGAIVGQVLGTLLARGRPRLRWPHSSHHETRALLAVLVAIGAIGPLVAVFQRTGYGLLRPLGRLFGDPLPLPRHVVHVCLTRHDAACDRARLLGGLNSPGTVLLDVLPLVVLLVAAVGLWNGRRAAAWAAIGVNAVLAGLAALYYDLLPVLGAPLSASLAQATADLTVQTFLAVLVPAAIAVAVAVNLRHCDLRTRRAVLLGSVGVVSLLTAAGLSGYLLLGLFAPGAFAPRPDAIEVLHAAVERYVPVGFLRPQRFDFAPASVPARLLSHWIGPVAWGALAVGVAACCLRIVRPRSGADEARVRELLRRGSTGSISWMATWPGNRYWFSSDGRHAVAYRENAGVAVTVGEPIGPASGLADAATAFVRDCDARAVTPAFYAVRPAFARGLGSEVPWASTRIGEDTVLDPSTFTMRGKAWQDVRSSINRADRAGVRAVWTDWSALSTATRTQIEAISEEWVADHRLPELGFTLGGVRELRDPEVQLMLAVGPEERVEAVTSWLPTWRDGESIGLTLDFMRRRSGSMNGVMEFLIASVVTSAQQRGLEFVSLSVAPLATTAGTAPDAVLQLLQLLSRLLEPAYGFASLATFKDKFKPAHLPVLLVYPDAVSLPAISVALTRAYLPDVGLRDLARLARAFRPEPKQPETAPPPRG